MNENKSSVVKFFKANGFYVVLIVCVIAAGVSSYLAVDTLMTQVNPEVQDSIESPDYNFEAQPADTSQSDIPIVSSSSEGTSTSESEEETQGVNASVAVSSSQITEEPAAEQTALPEAEVAQTLTEPAVETATEPQSTPTQTTFMMPVTGEVIKDFSGDELVYDETMADWRTHNGIDITAEKGAPVVASVAGTVTSVGYDEMWGGVVEITTGDSVVRYTGLSDDIPVIKEQHVNVGDNIGLVGELPCELMQPSHIHVEAIKAGKYFAFTDMNK